jgi:hypothetical protein
VSGSGPGPDPAADGRAIPRRHERAAVPHRVQWWQWPTVLSLDAPAVVLGWQAVVADVGRVDLGWPQAWVLASSVWMAYAADRWIEGLRLAPHQVRTARHAFAQRHRRAILVVWIAVLSCDLAVAFRLLSVRELVAGGSLLLPPVLAYLLSHQLVHRHHPWRVPKEIVVAVLLAAGVALFPLAHAGPVHRHLWPTLVLFGLLCFSNCALISRWELEVDRSHGQTSLAIGAGEAAWIRAVPWLLVVVSLGFGVSEAGPARVAAACAASSAFLLGLVDLAHGAIGTQRSRVLADVALLTPLVAMLAGFLP